MTEPINPLSIFDKGPWVWKETGQHFTGEQLDAEAFAKYRLAVEQATADLRSLLERRRKKHEATFLELAIAQRELAETRAELARLKKDAARLDRGWTPIHAVKEKAS